MSTAPSTSTSHSNFLPIFNAALESYRLKTKRDLASHPLLANLESCNSSEAVLAVLREQIPSFDGSQNRDDALTKWVVPTVNVLYAFSAPVVQGVGIAHPPANAIFAGIGVLLSAANDVSASRGKLVDILKRIERFFRRLEIYTEIPPTTAMTEMMVEIMVEVLAILAIATKELGRGRFKRYMKKLTGNRDIEDSLERLDKLTFDEARMAIAEQLKMTHGVDVKVKGVAGQVEDVRSDVQDVGDKVQSVEDKIHSDVQDVGDKVETVEGMVQDVGDKVQSVQGNIHDVHSDVQDIGDKVQNVEGMVQDLRGDVQDVREDVRGGVQDVGSRVQDVDDRVQGLEDKLDQASRIQLRDSLLRWLSPPNPCSNHNLAIKAHHDGTTEWFFRGTIFNHWKSTGSLLWVHGKPGSGKSVVCSSIIQDIMALHDARKASLAYFYFDFSDVDKQKLSNVLPSLLVQLSAESHLCCDKLSELYDAHGRGARKPSDLAMADCLKEMLALEGQAPIYIILDALDECPLMSSIPSPREEVLELVEDLVGLHLPNVHICVTSRPEPDIRFVLEPLTKQPVSLHDESGQNKDIADYVSSSVHSDRRMGRWREEDRQLVIKTLSEMAQGMFRWVFCQLELLRRCFPPSVRQILEELPKSLDGTYERILREIGRPNQGHAHRLLQCLVVAVRPLEVKELAEVLAVDFNTGESGGMPKLNTGWRWEDQEEAVTSACSSLITIVRDGDSRVVQFSHFSVKEFLTSNRLVEPIRDVSCYHIQLEAAHTILAQACLGVLLRLDDKVDRDNIENFPLALYAAEHWPTHGRVENVSSHINDGMDRIFDADKPHFATWLWIYNEDLPSYWNRSMSTMCPEEPDAVPLYYAARLGFRDLAERLIVEHPEHVNARGGSLDTPIHAAVMSQHANILSLLIDHGADIEGLESEHGFTPLSNAAYHGRFEVGQYLVDRGANINARDKYDDTPLILAAGDVEFARMLLERGAETDAQNNGGGTALHYASYGGLTDVVRLLLQHGADVNTHDESGETPSMSASLRGYQEIVELLSAHGAKIVKE